MAEAPQEPFVVRDCALSAIATGIRVQNLKELHERVQTIHVGAVFYHFWGHLLRPRFDNPDYPNDFAAWAREQLHDPPLAERLAVLDPSRTTDLEDLRRELLDVLEERLDDGLPLVWAPRDRQFHFIRSQIVVFDTAKRLRDPGELPELLPHLSLGSVFYHFVDARRRTDDGVDDFRAWLAGFDDGYAGLVQSLAEVGLYYVSLSDLRDRISAACARYFSGVGV